MLVPTDFSPDAERALDYAIALASALHARVTLLHVISAVYWAMGEVPGALSATVMEELETVAQQSLEQTLQRVHAARLDGDMVVHGSPFACVVATAHDQGVDLIAMGAHGRTGLPHVLLGSVADRVVRLAPCPVLVTRATSPASL
jgi:nucleotide-binding universal stress UspA family protein